MSLNKRSLRKDARPEPSLEDELRVHEKNLKSRRGSNRRAAFDGIRVHDEERAVRAVEALLPAASGKNLAELGALLASTGRARFVDLAVRGKYGDIALHDVLPAAVLHAAAGALAERMPRMPPAEVARRLRALGVVPLVERARSPEAERVVTAVLDDPRLPADVRRDAAGAALVLAPGLVWARRDTFDAALAVAAGLASGYAAPEALDVDTFVAGLASRPSTERAAILAATRLPSSAARLPPALQVPFLCAVLDEADGEQREACAAALARLPVPEAVEALLARPRVHPPSTVLACARVSPAEAHAVLAPLLAESEAARAAVVRHRSLRLDDAWIADALGLLNADPWAAAALLAAVGSRRAGEEVARAVAAADDALASLLLAGAVAGAQRAPVREASRGLAGEILSAVTLVGHGAGGAVVVALAAVRPRVPPVLREAVDDALRGRLVAD